MPFFQYKAVSPSGEVQEGVLEASSTNTAVARLQEMGFIPIRAEEAGGAKAVATAEARTPFFKKNRITQEDIGRGHARARHAAKAGLPLDRAFEILISLASSPKVAELLAKIRNDVRGGAALSKALDAQRGVFTRFYINMIRAGEAGGSLPTVLLRLAEYMERAKALRDNVKASLTYPVFLAGGVAPRGGGAAGRRGAALQADLRERRQGGAAHDAGGALRRRHDEELLDLHAVRLGGLILIAQRRLRDPEVRYKLDRFLVTGPVVGDLFTRLEMARFSRTLGTLLANGVTLVAALAIVRETMSNLYLAEAVGGVSRDLKEGRGLGRPMMETGRFPMLAVHMIQVGEETGRLDDMLMQVAETYDHEVEVAIRKALALLQPAMIVIMAAVIGFIIIAILSAMLSVYDLPI
jgi:general secretion pathway protein F